MKFLEELAARRRFGIRPGLESISRICSAMGNPQRDLKAIHVAGTNGKGAVCAILDAALRANGERVGRYISPHLVKLNERFVVDGEPIDDKTLEDVSSQVSEVISNARLDEITFFEALTAVAFKLFAEKDVGHAILECGLGGRLDATNVCSPELCVVTRIGLDHCDILGHTLEEIAAEKAGIIKRDVPIVLGSNENVVIEVFRKKAKECNAPFIYAPDIASVNEIPDGFSLSGCFNQENAITALASLKILTNNNLSDRMLSGFRKVVWPGRFHRIDRFIVDGAHNPPAAKALAKALDNSGITSVNLIAGFCGDKDVDEVLHILAPYVKKAYAVQTNNPRSLSAEKLVELMLTVGINDCKPSTLESAIKISKGPTLICGSLFLAGEAVVELGAYPWGTERFDPAETITPSVI